MERRIFLYMCGLSFIAFLLATTLTLWGFNSYFSRQMEDRVRAEAQIAAESLNSVSDRNELLDSFDIADSNSRITLIRPNGEVLFDSDADARTMENHLDRVEVSDALKNGTGEAVRVSGTLGNKTFYYAIRLDDGFVVRMAASASSVYSIFIGILPYLLFVGGFVFILCALLAYQLTQKIVSPIYTIDLEHPQDNHGYDELIPLLMRINEQNRLIKIQMDSLASERDTIKIILSNMREGLVLLDKDSKILSVNQSATRLLGVPNLNYLGQSLLVLTRDLILGESVAKALEGTHNDGILSLEEKYYHYFASPVYEKGTVNGAILLLLDITQMHQAEKLRREFSANVSHELKTPLTSISGYAEMIESGMAEAGDVKGFAGKIKSEALGLMALINDIIKLSRLDEAKDEMQFEPVNLLSAARMAARRLQQQAREKQVEIIIDGDEEEVNGEETMLQELIYNLCENAIKYNKQGGKVHINVSQGMDEVRLTVSDTGIGIPPEHQGRVFERFYRVDKSHSKKTAGTGLGLAIVKHIAQYHGAKISLESEEFEGTKIIVDFKLPAAQEKDSSPAQNGTNASLGNNQIAAAPSSSQ